MAQISPSAQCRSYVAWSIRSPITLAPCTPINWIAATALAMYARRRKTISPRKIPEKNSASASATPPSDGKLAKRELHAAHGQQEFPRELRIHRLVARQRQQHQGIQPAGHARHA